MVLCPLNSIKQMYPLLRIRSFFCIHMIFTRDIQKTKQKMYGIDMDDSRVSKITNKIAANPERAGAISPKRLTLPLLLGMMGHKIPNRKV